VTVEVVAAVIRNHGKILITQRLDDVHLARLWEFPGGKVEAGESLETALQREIREELGIAVAVGEEFFTIEHDYPEKSVRLHFFNCSIEEGVAEALGVADLRWVLPEELSGFEFPPADTELIEKLRN
jgi:mutator protein MutT